MSARCLPSLLACGALCALPTSVPAQTALPRDFGPLRLGMSVTQFKAIVTHATLDCPDECLPGETTSALAPDQIPSPATAFLSLGLDSLLVATADGLDCQFYQARLVRLFLPAPAAAVDSAVALLTAQLGPWHRIEVYPSGTAVVLWQDRSTGVTLVYKLVSGVFTDGMTGAETLRLEVFDRRADSLMAAASSARGPTH